MKTLLLECGVKAQVWRALQDGDALFPIHGTIEGVEGFQAWTAQGRFCDDFIEHPFDMVTPPKL